MIGGHQRFHTPCDGGGVIDSKSPLIRVGSQIPDPTPYHYYYISSPVVIIKAITGGLWGSSSLNL